MKIPQQVKDLAKENGMNSIKYICTHQNVEYYGLGLVDSNGFQLPIGLPTIVRGNKLTGYELIFEEEGLNLCKMLTDLPRK